MGWSIEYYSERVEKAILTLPSGLLARYLHLTDLMLSLALIWVCPIPEQ